MQVKANSKYQFFNVPEFNSWCKICLLGKIYIFDTKSIPVGDPALICHWKVTDGTSSGIPGLIWNVNEKPSKHFPE